MVLTAKAVPIERARNETQVGWHFQKELARNGGLRDLRPHHRLVDDHQAHGMNTYVVAIIPLAVFTLTGIMGKEELKLINWDVLWLVAGGIAIGIALDKTGLAEALAHAIDYEALSPFAVVVALSIVCWLMANFMSNTATANLLMPIAAAIGVSMPSLAAVGGLQGLLVVVAFSASLGMILPVSTPPNSLAYSTGLIESKDMAKVGLIIGLIGLFIVYGAVLILF